MRGLVVMLAIAACGSPNPGTDPDGPGDSNDGPPSDGMPGDGMPDDGMATGDAPPDPCALGTWSTEDSPVSGVLLHSVWAADLNNVFAVGDDGTILRRRDNVWTAMDSTTTKDLRGVGGVSATDVWAAGADGTLLHYDGNAWTARGTLTADLAGIYAAATNDVWIVGTGTAVHWNGSQLTSDTLIGTVFAVSGTAGNNVWATGESARVAHYTTSWQTGIDPGAGITYFAILALPGEVWVSSFTPNEETVRFSGGTWTPHDTNGAVFQSFHAVASNNIWAAGGVTVGRWNGSTWVKETPAGNSVSLFGTGGIGASFWVVGRTAANDPIILHRRD